MSFFAHPCIMCFSFFITHNIYVSIQPSLSRAAVAVLLSRGLKKSFYTEEGAFRTTTCGWAIDR